MNDMHIGNTETKVPLVKSERLKIPSFSNRVKKMEFSLLFFIKFENLVV